MSTSATTTMFPSSQTMAQAQRDNYHYGLQRQQIINQLQAAQLQGNGQTGLDPRMQQLFLQQQVQGLSMPMVPSSQVSMLTLQGNAQQQAVQQQAAQQAAMMVAQNRGLQQ